MLLVVSLGVASSGLAACSDTELSSAPDGGEVPVGELPRPSIVPDDDSGTAVSPDSVPPATDATGAAVVPVVPADTVASGATTIAPVPSSIGVPGIDSTDALCASWARLAGTRQVLTAAANLGGLSDVSLARLEVVAAPFVLEAIQRLDGALEELGGDVRAERGAVMDDLLGRVGARADGALTALTELAPPDGTTALLSQVWLDALRRLDPASPLPPLADLGPQLGPIVDRAAAAFADDAPRWEDDPALDVSGVEVPATERLVDRTCPDLSALGVDDAV